MQAKRAKKNRLLIERLILKSIRMNEKIYFSSMLQLFGYIPKKMANAQQGAIFATFLRDQKNCLSDNLFLFRLTLGRMWMEQPACTLQDLNHESESLVSSGGFSVTTTIHHGMNTFLVGNSKQSARCCGWLVICNLLAKRMFFIHVPNFACGVLTLFSTHGFDLLHWFREFWRCSASHNFILFATGSDSSQFCALRFVPPHCLQRGIQWWLHTRLH